MTSNIWPRELPASVRKDPRRRAEARVYDRLRQDLDNSFHVFYSGPWLAIDEYGNERDGECDFLIAHKNFGILAIEVKGGGISFDPASGQWLSRDRHGFDHYIKNPVNQAKSAKHNTIEKLKVTGGWNVRYIRARHGVIFPDSDAPRQNLGADMPKDLFLCGPDIESGIIDWVTRRMRPHPGASEEPLGADGLKVLEKLFAQPFSLSFRISSALTADMEELGTLLPSQYRILDYTVDVDRALIQGAAGTGKTVIAIEEAIRSARAGRRTLLTCYNRSLGLLLERSIQDDSGVDAGSFHSVCRDAAIATGLLDRNKFLQDADFEKLPDFLVRAMEIQPELRWEEIVVDEGQDFEPTWWLALEAALVPGGRLRVFMDSNQRLYPDRVAEASDLISVPLRLKENLRNTKNIHEASLEHYSGLPVTSEGPEGVEVRRLKADSVDDAIDRAFSEVRNLVFQEGLDPADIAVLVPNQQAVDRFRSVASHSRIDFTSGDRPSREAATLDTIRRFKGLESPAIILVLGRGDLTPTEMAYVGMTRARVFLLVISANSDD